MAAGSSATTQNPEINKKLGLDELAAQYGYAAAFFNSDPELKGLINRAVAEQWSTDRFRAGFMNTAWYRDKAEAAKQFLELEGRNPAEAKLRISNKRRDILQMATQMGITISGDRLDKIARDALMFGGSDQIVKDMVASEFHYKPGGQGGSAAGVETKLRSLAADYGVSVSDSTVAQMVTGYLKGDFTDDTLSDWARDTARSKYAGMKGYIDQGFTVRQVAQPYIQSYSQILEQAPDAVQLTDPTVQKALQGVKDPKTGVPQMQSVYEFEQSLRKDPRWLKTKNAHNDMESVALKIAQDFGIHS